MCYILLWSSAWGLCVSQVGGLVESLCLLGWKPAWVRCCPWWWSPEGVFAGQGHVCLVVCANQVVWWGLCQAGQVEVLLGCLFFWSWVLTWCLCASQVGWLLGVFVLVRLGVFRGLSAYHKDVSLGSLLWSDCGSAWVSVLTTLIFCLEYLCWKEWGM